MSVAFVLLAAGRARRFGADKLLSPLWGKMLIDHALARLDAFAFDAAVCVVRPDGGVADHVRDRIRTVVNDKADAGMATSLAVGIAAVPAVEAAFVVLADMPQVPRHLFAEMVSARHRTGAQIVVPVHDGQQGHPVLFARDCFADLLALQGDVGAKSIVRSGRYRCIEVESDSGGILRDVDVPEDLSGL